MKHELEPIKTTHTEYDCTSEMSGTASPNSFKLEIHGFPEARVPFNASMLAVMIEKTTLFIQGNAECGHAFDEDELENIFKVMRDANSTKRTYHNPLDKIMNQILMDTPKEELDKILEDAPPGQKERMTKMIDKRRKELGL